MARACSFTREVRVIAADQQQHFVVVSVVSSLFIITDIIARVAPRARCALLVLLMHINL